MGKCIVSISEESQGLSPFYPYLSKGQLYAKSLQLFEPDIVVDPVDVISTKLNIVVDGDWTPDDFVFVPFFADFKSKKKPQILIIDTTPLHYIKGISISGLVFEPTHTVHINGIYVDDGNDNWPEISHDQPISGRVDKLMFLFKMPTNKKTERFKFLVKIQTDQRVAPLECDPQVGNDPPKQAGVP